MTLPMTFFDTHCHLQAPEFRDIDAVLARASAAGVDQLLVCGYDLASSKSALAMSETHAAVLPAVGVHPHDARGVSQTVADRIEALAAEERVVAIGEIGLDFYRDLSPRDDQLRVLELHLALAVATGKPVSIHSRAAEEEIYAPLKAYAAQSPLPARQQPVGVMHCFGGTLDQARRYVDLGFLVAIPCTVTYPNNDLGRELARELPLDVLVVETDSPYLPPQSRRGKRNEPAYVAEGVAEIARLRGITPAEVAAATSANAARTFRLPAPAEAVSP